MSKNTIGIKSRVHRLFAEIVITRTPKWRHVYFTYKHTSPVRYRRILLAIAYAAMIQAGER